MKTIKYNLTLALLTLCLVAGCASTQEVATWMETTTVSNSPQSQYNILKRQEAKLTSEIDAINQKMADASSSKQRRYNKELEPLYTQLSVVQRRMSTFPESITNPDYVAEKVDDTEFRSELDAAIKEKLAESDPYGSTISNDSDLERLYRVYLNDGGQIPLLDSNGNIADENSVIKYHVLFAIVKSELPSSKLPKGGNILKQQLPNGQIAYYQGSFTSKADAEALCRKVASETSYRDAFVVATKNGKRI